MTKIAYLSPFAALAAFFIPGEAVEPLARVLVPAVALMATAIFPCMTLVVNAMKGEHRTPAVVEELYARLRLLLKLLVTTFVLAIGALAAMATAVGIINADPLPNAPKILTSVAALVLVLMLGRIVDVGRAFFVLLEVNRKHSLLVARAKVRSERDASMTAGRGALAIDDDPTPRPMHRIN